MNDRNKDCADIDLEVRKLKQLVILSVSCCVPDFNFDVLILPNLYQCYFILEGLLNHMTGSIKSVVVVSSSWMKEYECLKAAEPADLSPIARRFIC